MSRVGAVDGDKLLAQIEQQIRWTEEWTNLTPDSAARRDERLKTYRDIHLAIRVGSFSKGEKP